MRDATSAHHTGSQRAPGAASSPWSRSRSKPLIPLWRLDVRAGIVRHHRPLRPAAIRFPRGTSRREGLIKVIASPVHRSIAPALAACSCQTYYHQHLSTTTICLASLHMRRRTLVGLLWPLAMSRNCLPMRIRDQRLSGPSSPSLPSPSSSTVSACGPAYGPSLP